MKNSVGITVSVGEFLHFVVEVELLERKTRT